MALSLALLLLAGAGSARAGTPTENHDIRALPAPGAVVVDGRFDDWDLAGGLFVCGDAEKRRDTYSYWAHVMYDQEHLYVLARVRDREPMSNRGVTGFDNGFRDDCWQFRLITNTKQPNECVAHVTAWQGKDERRIIDITYGRTFKDGNVKNALDEGAEMALRKDDDGRGYTQEIKLPLRLIGKDTAKLASGMAAVMTFEMFFGPGTSVKDNFRPGISPDRIFTFRAYDNWGTVTFVEKAPVQPQPVRLADGRQFPVRMENGRPVVDWTGLVKDPLAAGFKEINFDMPFDGYASIHVRNAEGAVVRQLVNGEFFAAGKHEVKWDGLTTPKHLSPGQPVAAGSYTWHAIAHPGLDLVLRGWASNAGSAPWDSSRTSNWGGDHGVPSDLIAAGPDRMILGWTGAEAGKPVVCVDLDGNVQWRHIRGGMGGGECVAYDAGIVYILDHGTVIYRLDLKTGEPSFWAGAPSADLSLASLWTESIAGSVTGMEVHDGRLYLSYAGVKLPEVTDPEAAWKIIESREGIAGAIYAAMTAKPLRGTPNAAAIAKALQAFYNATADKQNVLDTFAVALAKAGKTDFIAVLDATTGKLEQTIPIASPGRLRSAGNLYVLSGPDALVELDPQTGKTRTLVTGLKTARGLSADSAGNVYVALGEGQNCVKVFDRAGKELRVIGKPGGRKGTGPWDPAGMWALRACALDAQNRVWIAESHDFPKRFAIYDGQSGAFVKEFLGPTHYGASGGAISPRDPDVMVGEGCEWKLDATGRAACVGVYARAIPRFARFAEGRNGRQYLLTNAEREGEMYVYQRLAPGDYRLRGRVGSDAATGGTRFWADADGDQQEQETEIQRLPYPLSFAGYLGWSLSAQPDLTLYAATGKFKAPPFDSKTQTREQHKTLAKEIEAKTAALPASVRIAASNFTACGAPVWDLENVAPLPVRGSGLLASLDGRVVVGEAEEEWVATETATGRQLWAYPNLWSGVHGSHRAPPPENGLIRGAFGLVGCAKGPEPVGHIWAINSNVGEWHLLTETGFYLSRLFQGDLLEVKWPASAQPGTVCNDVPAGAGAEDFGGTLTQTTDGRVFVQAGKVAFWNLELEGLESIRALSGGR